MKLIDEKVWLQLLAADSDIVARQAFQVIDRHYRPFVRERSFILLRARAPADELTQDIFVILWNRRKQATDIQDLTAYLRKMVTNNGFKMISQNARDQQKHIDIDTLSDYASQAVQVLPDESMDWKRRLLQFRKVLRLLPERRREIYLLRLRGHSRIEIATLLNIAPDTVKVQLVSANKRIRDEIQKGWPGSLWG